MDDRTRIDALQGRLDAVRLFVTMMFREMEPDRQRSVLLAIDRTVAELTVTPPASPHGEAFTDELMALTDQLQRHP